MLLDQHFQVQQSRFTTVINCHVMKIRVMKSQQFSGEQCRF